MNDTPLDMLQIKIERARDELPEITKKAINAVDWRGFILSLKEKKGYSLEQLEDLELETELMLCGLTNPANYQSELEKRMEIPKPQAELLVNEMNEGVFKKIREELIKNTEREELFVKTDSVNYNKNPVVANENKAPVQNITSQNVPTPPRPNIATNNILEKKEVEVLNKTGIEIKPENTEKKVEPISAQKLVGSFQIPTIKTEYSLNNITKNTEQPTNDKIKLSKTDPYRIDPNE